MNDAATKTLDLAALNAIAAPHGVRFVVEGKVEGTFMTNEQLSEETADALAATIEALVGGPEYVMSNDGFVYIATELDRDPVYENEDF